MKHYKNINGSTIAAFFPLTVIPLAIALGFIFPYRQAIVILIVPLALMFVGTLLIVTSKWKQIMSGHYTLLGTSSEKGFFKFLYKFGYALILLGLILAVIKLF